MFLRPLILLLPVSILLAFVPQEAIFHSRVALVRLDIVALDATGGILTGLQRQDFRVLDNGIEQSASAFSFEKEALDLILLFDVGKGMGSKLHQILRAIELGFHELQPGDRVCLMTYAEVVTQIAPFTADLETVNQNIVLKIVGGGFQGAGKPEEAVSAAARRLEKEPLTQRRRAILAIAQQPGSPGRTEAVIQELWAADAVFGELVPEKSGRNRILPAGENPLADRTGGETILAGDPGPAFQDSLRRLRRRYTFYYAMPQAEAGSRRSVSVALTAESSRRFPGATVRARTGYVVTGER